MSLIIHAIQTRSVVRFLTTHLRQLILLQNNIKNILKLKGC